MPQEKEHYLIVSPWDDKPIGCCLEEPNKEGFAVIDKRDVILRPSPALTCIYCGKTLNEIIEEGKKQGKSAHDALLEAGIIKIGVLPEGVD